MFYTVDPNEEKKEFKIEEKPKVVPIKIELPENSPLKRLVAPHNKISREVTEADVERVVEEAKVLYDICFVVSGPYGGAYAMAEPQIDDKDPLRFYVTADRTIVINPIITRHSNYTIKHKEGCMTYPGIEWIEVDRWHKCEITFISLIIDPLNSTKFKLSEKQNLSLSGIDSFCAQHEMDHFTPKYIYD